MGKIGEDIVYLFSALIGVAILAVLFSKGAQTSTVIGSTFSGFAQVLSAAVAPVTGADSSIGGIDTISASGLSLLQSPNNMGNAIANIFGSTSTVHGSDPGNATPIGNLDAITNLFGNSSSTDSISGLF